MLSRGQHAVLQQCLIPTWTSRSQCLNHLVKSLHQLSNRTACTGCHRDRILLLRQNPWSPRVDNYLKNARGFCSTKNWTQTCTKQHHLLQSREAFQIQGIFHKPLKAAVFLRPLSSESDPGQSASFKIDITEEGLLVDDVAKELDAEGAGEIKTSPRNGSKRHGSLTESLVSVGKLVPDKIVNLLDEEGESLGSLHRAEAIKQSQKTGLKLVLVNSKTKPYPTYRLMTGKQLHQEQMVHREKAKNASAQTQIKEVRLSGNIEKHDLEVKRKHLQGWLKEGESHVHVRVTVMGGGKGVKKITKEQQMAVVHQLMNGVEDRVTFASKPRDIGREGMNLSVVLRPMSAKEKAKRVKQKNAEESLKLKQAAEDSREEERVQDEKVDS
ncbi:uncharacterized protein [Asterias amurensis]|uniref:uncharacterized protein n=1 Tax=Asterias amurensis TaxID=7602 RepID=UPI003AB26318